MPFQSLNPYTQEVEAAFETLSGEGLEKKLQLAEETFRAWRKSSFAERSEKLVKVATLLENEEQSWAEMMTREMGKPIAQAKSEVQKCAKLCRFYAQEAAHFLQDQPKQTEAHKSFVSHEPLGPVLAVMPWNFPFWQVFRFACPALMAGNVGLLKHASNVPQCAIAIENIFLRAGFPKGAFQTLLISGKRASSLMEHPSIKAATLTGSEQAGSALASSAGKHLKKTVLELGGSDPFIVLPGADLEKAAQVGATSRLINSGQSCIAAKRFIVLEACAEDFIDHFRRAMQDQVSGDPMDESTSIGPLARLDLLEELQAQVDDSVAKGAKLLLGGKRHGPRSAFFEPSILYQIPENAPAAREELFGPVASLFVVKDEQEAIRMANDSRYGLGASLWTKDLDRAEGLARELEAGCVFVNELVKSNQAVPFGGVKQSGYGRELSDLGIKEFTNQKTIWIEL